MSCETCNRSLTLPKCIDIFDVGTITANTTVFIYLQNNTTGRLIRQDAISSVTGLVQFDASDVIFNENHSYEVYLTPFDSHSMDDRITMTGAELEYTCLNITFSSVYDADSTTSTPYPYYYL